MARITYEIDGPRRRPSTQLAGHGSAINLDAFEAGQGQFIQVEFPTHGMTQVDTIKVNRKLLPT
jgi:hypothetical protein